MLRDAIKGKVLQRLFKGAAEKRCLDANVTIPLFSSTQSIGTVDDDL